MAKYIECEAVLAMIRPDDPNDERCAVDEKNALRNDVTKMVDRAAFECRRADYAESHPWRNLWAWVKRKLVRKA